ncbi:MAG: nicotinate phosphoribosyltransferase [Candidatus Asgardarchaeia archaeon]
MKRIINSILDNDLYKFTMQQAALELFPNAEVTYAFKNRGDQRFTPEFITELKSQISRMIDIKLTPDEYFWLKNNISFYKPQYLEYLANYRFNPGEVDVILNDNNDLVLNISGKWHTTILWEVPLIALISELYFKMIDTEWKGETIMQRKCFPDDWYGDLGLTWEDAPKRWDKTDQRENAFIKIREMQKNQCGFADFGTRRRRSFENQDKIIKAFMDFQKGIQDRIVLPDEIDEFKPSPDNGFPFVGTSNLYFAMKYGLKPIGTMAHEWIMAMAILEGLYNSNYYALQNWVRVYNSDLGIALTDTYGLQTFLRNFNIRLAKLYDGVRHDSGCPFNFADAIISYYNSLNIDPTSKTIVFSDGLNIENAIQIKKHCTDKWDKPRIKCSFGIGTHLTNDLDGSKALNIVIKLFSCEGIPVVKLSDVEGKVMGDPDAVRVAKWMFQKRPLDWKHR